MEESVLPFDLSETIHFDSLSGDIGVLYLLKNILTEKIKIGWTVNYNQRIKQLNVLEEDYIQPLFLFAIKEHAFRAKNAEGQLHELFCLKRLKGEWFDLNEKDISIIKHLMKRLGFYLVIKIRKSERIKRAF